MWRNMSNASPRGKTKLSTLNFSALDFHLEISTLKRTTYVRSKKSTIDSQFIQRRDSRSNQNDPTELPRRSLIHFVLLIRPTGPCIFAIIDERGPANNNRHKLRDYKLFTMRLQTAICRMIPHRIGHAFLRQCTHCD